MHPLKNIPNLRQKIPKTKIDERNCRFKFKGNHKPNWEIQFRASIHKLPFSHSIKKLLHYSPSKFIQMDRTPPCLQHQTMVTKSHVIFQALRHWDSHGAIRNHLWLSKKDINKNIPNTGLCRCLVRGDEIVRSQKHRQIPSPAET